MSGVKIKVIIKIREKDPLFINGQLEGRLMILIDKRRHQ